MLKLLLLVVLLAVVVFMVSLMLRGARVEAARRGWLAAKVREVTDLAYLHDELSPGLADAVIARTRGLGEDTTAPELQRALDDVLDLCRSHRETEPDLAVIFIDTVRTNELGS